MFAKTWVLLRQTPTVPSGGWRAEPTPTRSDKRRRRSRHRPSGIPSPD